MMFYKSLLEMKTGTRVSGFNEDVATTWYFDGLLKAIFWSRAAFPCHFWISSTENYYDSSAIFLNYSLLLSLLSLLFKLISPCSLRAGHSTTLIPFGAGLCILQSS
jgi:hypothetical protein